MGENVTYFGDVADKFDALVAYDEKELDSWVESEGYSVKSMVFASTQDPLGSNPDLIKPDQKLFTPNLPLAKISSANAIPSASMVVSA